MSKELEALMTFNYIITRCKDEDSYIIKFPLGIQKGTTFGEDMEKAYKVIKEALQRLEAIDNVKPNEALECFRDLTFYGCFSTIDEDMVSRSFDECCIVIKQALLKAQEQEKVLEIVFNKYVNIEYLKHSYNVREYNSRITVIKNGEKYYSSMSSKLTTKEFELLKEMLK